MAGLGSRQRWIVGGAGLVLVVGLSVTLLAPRLSGPSIDRARAAYDQGDWSKAQAIAARLLEARSDDLEALRIQSRSLTHLGQPGKALAIDVRLGGGRLEAEDLVLLGRALVDQGRKVLGWSAFEAASRLGPRSPLASEALAGIPRKAPELALTDRLSAVEGGPALAELVVGLAGFDHGPARPGDFDKTLDRVLQRDRSSLRQIRTPTQARNLLARLLLEIGRAPEARDHVIEAALANDPEANWLLGRAFLSEGDFDLATQATERAGRYGTDDPMALEPSRYVGAKRCEVCHQEIYQAQQSSHHAGTIAWGEGLKSVPLPSGDLPDPENPQVVHRFERSDREIKTSAKVEGRSIQETIDYALGSGHHGITMLSRDPGGRHRSLRISYYSGGNHWGLTSGFEARPKTAESYVGEVLNEESFRSCLNCHTTRFTSEQDRSGPEVADRGIGCERCHGPGENHIRAVESGFRQPAIARPRLAEPSRRLKLCAQCHASDGVIPPVDPRFIRFQATTLPYSRCVTESGGKLDCVACHDPHRDVETNPVAYEARCLACHGGTPHVEQARSKLRVEAVKAAPCPVNALEGCVSCHMPKVAKIMPFMSFTDHHIRIHRPIPKAGP